MFGGGQYPKRFNTRTSTLVSYEEWKALDEKDEQIISRKPLEPNETTTLIQTAINLHDSAIQAQQNKRWWIPVFTGILSFIGVIAGLAVGKLF